MKPKAFNYAEVVQMKSEMDKRNAYTNVLKAENARLSKRVKTLLSDAEQVARTEQAMLKRLEELEAENNDLKAMNAKTEDNFTQYAEEMNEELTALKRENKTLRNELCQKCGRYIDAHNGSCNGCRWRAKE